MTVNDSEMCVDEKMVNTGDISPEIAWVNTDLGGNELLQLFTTRCSSLKESVLELCKTYSGIRFKCMGTLSTKTYKCLRESSDTFYDAYPPLANLFYPERLAALDLEPLELRRLKSDLVLYYKCVHDLVALPSSEYLRCQISPRKRKQVVVYCSVLCALLNFMKTTFLIAVYLAGIFYHIQWLMLAPIRVSNTSYQKSVCQLLHIVLLCNNL